MLNVLHKWNENWNQMATAMWTTTVVSLYRESERLRDVRVQPIRIVNLHCCWRWAIPQNRNFHCSVFGEQTQRAGAPTIIIINRKIRWHSLVNSFCVRHSIEMWYALCVFAICAECDGTTQLHVTWGYVQRAHTRKCSVVHASKLIYLFIIIYRCHRAPLPRALVPGNQSHAEF